MPQRYNALRFVPAVTSRICRRTNELSSGNGSAEFSIPFHLVRLLVRHTECSHMALRFLNLSKSALLLSAQTGVVYHTLPQNANPPPKNGERSEIAPRKVSVYKEDVLPYPFESYSVNQLIMEPAGTSGRSVVSSDRFPSASSAQSSIPCDSIPASFAGFRLVITTTFLPTISSGL